MNNVPSTILAIVIGTALALGFVILKITGIIQCSWIWIYVIVVVVYVIDAVRGKEDGR